MTNPTLIPTNFKVPKGCRHQYILFYERTLAAFIKGCPGSSEIEFSTFDTPVSATEEQRKKFSGRSMDWMEESIDHLRAVCGGNH